MSISYIYNGDCMDYMHLLPDNHFDICICDPPYGIDAGNMQMGTGRHRFKKKIDWDKNIPDQKFFEEIFRVSKNQIIWGGNYFHLPLNNNWIIWDKLNPNLSFSECELAWCSLNFNTRIFKRLSTLPDIDGPKQHITQKPVALYKWLLKRYATPGQLILDTHLGSGSSRIAAYDLGFDFYGCELDKDYYEAQEKRFAKHISQQKLFTSQQISGVQTSLL
jgi:site-specific DNA-methyltransferase (adenine-specific)